MVIMNDFRIIIIEISLMTILKHHFFCTLTVYVVSVVAGASIHLQFGPYGGGVTHTSRVSESSTDGPS